MSAMPGEDLLTYPLYFCIFVFLHICICIFADEAVHGLKTGEQ